MKKAGMHAVVLEPGPAMMNLTGVRWGRSERTFAVVIPQSGDPAYVLPAFEEKRARELIQPGADIMPWEEDESPFAKIAQVFRERGVSSGRVGIEDSVRFFVFEGIRKQAPKLSYVSCASLLIS